MVNAALFGGDSCRNSHDSFAFQRHVIRCMGLHGKHSVANLKTRDPRRDTFDFADVAVSDPARVVWRPRHFLCTLVIATVSTRRKSGDFRLDPDLVAVEILRVENEILET